MNGYVAYNKLVVHNTPMSVVITSTKIATQFITQFFGHEEGGYSDVYVRRKDGDWDISANNYPFEINPHLEILKDILKKEVKKDIIVLIRSPYERFKSSLTQDFIKPLFGNENKKGIDTIRTFSLVSCSLLKNADLKDDMLLYWWTKNIYKIYQYITNGDVSIFRSDSLDTFNKCCKIIIEQLIVFWNDLEFDIFSYHNNPYHQLVNNFLKSIHSRNQKNIKIIDIDESDINKVFSKYIPGSKNIGIIHKGGFFRKILDDVLESEEFSHTKKELLTRLEFELMSYDILYENRDKNYLKDLDKSN